MSDWRERIVNSMREGIISLLATPEEKAAKKLDSLMDQGRYHELEPDYIYDDLMTVRDRVALNPKYVMTYAESKLDPAEMFFKHPVSPSGYYAHQLISKSKELYPQEWAMIRNPQIPQVNANPMTVYVASPQAGAIQQWADGYADYRPMPAVQVGPYDTWGEGFAPTPGRIPMHSAPPSMPVDLAQIRNLRDRLQSTIDRGVVQGVDQRGLDNIRNLVGQYDARIQAANTTAKREALLSGKKRRGRGRPKGSKNKPKGPAGQTT